MTARRPRLTAVAATVAVALLASCSTGDDAEEDATPSTEATTTTAAPASTEPPPQPTLDQVQLELQEVAELDEPIALAWRSGSPDLYVAEKGGRVRRITVTPGTGTRPPRYQVERTPVLDLSKDVVNQGEQGLLGIAFSSDGRRLYVDYTARGDGRTVVAEYAVGDRGTVDAGTRRVLLEVEQPYANHNGGQVVVGRDGFLYVGLGDGGDAGDPHGHGQDTSTLLGSILRIDPLGATEEAAYAIPAGNPFADGEAGAPETWLYGVRNPWRFTFDRTTGDLWVADVGQNQWEEVTHLPATGGFDAGRGANLGWDRVEGTHEFEGENPSGAVLPLHEYSHEEGGCSITGGYVYRGKALPALQGAYLFADFCAAGLRAIQVHEGAVIGERTWDLPLEQVQSFGEDEDGEVFVLLAGGPVLKLVPAR